MKRIVIVKEEIKEIQEGMDDEEEDNNNLVYDE